MRHLLIDQPAPESDASHQQEILAVHVGERERFPLCEGMSVRHADSEHLLHQMAAAHGGVAQRLERNAQIKVAVEYTALHILLAHGAR